MIHLWTDKPTRDRASSRRALRGSSPSLSGQRLGAVDRKLGYFGQRRFVVFYYEPRGEEVMWNDGQSYGFGSGGWMTFTDEIAPAAATHGLNLGSNDETAAHVLLVDRRRGRAYFSDRQRGEAIVARQQSARLSH